ncbi:MAG TPA: hydantoinase/oxoprolinase family protein [Desulfuromonadales bacterium]|nr:hydantoinase/oxoprolinase family protein [Desulfuromonadales bacterium]
MDRHIPMVGVDTGGTFTDFVLVEGRQVRTYKLPSTPDDPSRAVLAGLRHLLGDRETLVFHGSTVATNALLEGKGDAVVLVVTAGFRDLLAIGRQNRPKLYALHPRRQPPLVPRERTVEVRERILADGSVETPLTGAEKERVVAAVTASGCRSVALCLLHAYANPEHERQLLEALVEAGLQVSASCRILSEYREFERASTTAVNAAVSPVMERYLRRLQQGLGGGHLKIMQSNGGSILAETAGREAVRTILSGPAGGMVGAFATARAAGCHRVLTFDMGGTSTDVALCEETIPFTAETVIAGWPVKVPMIDIHTVGAGGGSIARLDAGGALRVGPQSAGADPGPACYGRGGAVTVTDANLYLGRLLPDRFLGGRMWLDVARSRQAIEGLARQSGLEPVQLAEGILEVAEATMAGALRVVSIERGHDPRDFVLLPFGGAGGLHACALAEKLAIPRVLIPVHPGLLSAVGMILADAIRDYSRSLLQPATAAAAELEGLLSPMRRQALTEMAAEGVEAGQLQLLPSLDLRYRGQSFEVNVPLAGDYLSEFHSRHEMLYGYRDDWRPAEIVTLRLRAVGRGPRPDLTRGACRTGEAAPERTVPVVLDGRQIDCPTYERERLPCGSSFAGPALVVEETATHLVRVGWKAEVDGRGNLLLERTTP